MAGDWIKMRGNLWDDPRVSQIMDMTDSTEGPVVGALYWLWATADQHSEDGFMPGLTLRQIDRKTSLPGFAAALCLVGWLADGPNGVTIVKFEEHNGTSAKRRCSDAQRKANGRNLSASDADICETQTGKVEDETRRLAELEKEKSREEKKEEKKTTPAPSAWVSSSELIADGLPESLAGEWLAHRKAKKAKLTALAWAGFKNEVSKAGWSLEDAVLKAIARNWTTFEAKWVANAQSPPRTSYADQQRAVITALTTSSSPTRTQGDFIDV
jgi:hypothetical protein